MTEQVRPDVPLRQDLRFVFALIASAVLAIVQTSTADLPWGAGAALFLGETAGILVLLLPLVCGWCLVRRRLADPPLYARASLVSIGLVELALVFTVLVCILLRPMLVVLPR